MTCPAPTNVQICYLSGPDQFRVTWFYPHQTAVSFRITLQCRTGGGPWTDGPTNCESQYSRTTLFPNDIEPPPNDFRAYVEARCKDCSLSEKAYSNEITP